MPHVKVHFWRGSGWIGAAIRFVSWGDFAHVAIEIDGVIYEAREFCGVVKWPVDRWDPERPKSDQVLFLECSDGQKSLMKSWLNERIGTPYDYVGVVSFLPRRSEDKWTKYKLFCSELVCDVCEYAGTPLFNRVDGSQVPPAWVHRSLRLKNESTLKNKNKS